MTFSHDGNQILMSFYGKASAQNVVEGLDIINAITFVLNVINS